MKDTKNLLQGKGNVSKGREEERERKIIICNFFRRGLVIYIPAGVLTFQINQQLYQQPVPLHKTVDKR